MKGQYYGQFDIPVDKFIFERYFRDVGTKGVFVECGAFDGITECSCRFFEETMEWEGFNLEPVPWIFDRLVENRPNSRNINAGLSGISGQSAFVCVNHPTFGRFTTIGSIEIKSETSKLLEGQGCSFDEISVNVLCWDDFVNAYNIREIDLMVLDVEGHELDVIDGMMESTVLPHIMCVEFGHVGFHKLRLGMSKLGYEYDTNSFANAFFIRKDKLALFGFRRSFPLGGNFCCEVAALREEVSSLRGLLNASLREPIVDRQKGNGGWRSFKWSEATANDLSVDWFERAGRLAKRIGIFRAPR